MDEEIKRLEERIARQRELLNTDPTRRNGFRRLLTLAFLRQNVELLERLRSAS